MTSLARRFKLGRAAYEVLYRPIGAIRQSIREGGPIQQWVTSRGRMEMEYAAERLTPSAQTNCQVRVDAHIVTGRRFWYQTAFCIRSLIAHCHTILVRPVFYDDGTLGSYQALLGRIFPTARFISDAELRDRVERLLPRKQFPSLRDRWDNYPIMRKMVGVHLGTHGWKLILDSDMLFFRSPDLVIDWLVEAAAPVHAVDVKQSYGYPREALVGLAGADVHPRLNAGLYGLRSDNIEWPRVEHWIHTLKERYGTSYFLEQAVVAMLMAGQPCVVAPMAEYVTWPDEAECANPAAVMHHYVSLSKRCYFRTGWRECLRRIELAEKSA